ncbi:MAG: AMP-binding protein, partial [Mycobacterium sp.]|nr:AMP-binding protein [Mycobacterium sp.]
ADTTDKQLIAYAVPEPNTPTTTTTTQLATELRQYAATHLPQYMVPTAITIIDALPLTPNGKLNRQALPTPQFTTTTTYRPPRNQPEQTLATLFTEILGIPHIGIDDNFFDLGGHSLTATRLITRIRTELNTEIPLRTIFNTPTITGLTNWLGTHTATRPQAALTPQPRPQPMPLSYAQTRLWFIHKYEGPSATYNTSLALRLTGRLDTTALTTAIGDVAARHESLRTVFPETNGIPYQQILPADTVEVPVTLTEVSDGHQQLDAAITEAVQCQFDLAAQIPIRADLLRVSAIEQVLVLAIHHIAADGASMVPLAQDLATAYTARCDGQAPQWSPLPVQYADYTLWQHEILGRDDDPNSMLSQQVNYWRHELAGAPEHITLPFNRLRPPRQSFRGEQMTFTIDPHLRHRIETQARGCGATTSMLLQAALAVLLHKLGAGDDLTIGGPIAGRTDTALTGLIGFFVNTWVLRVDTSGNPRFSDLLTQVRGKALGAYENQDVPFERLVELLNPARSTACHPLFQVSFALQNNPLPTFELPGLDIEILPAPTHTAKFDLFMNIVELPGRSEPLPGVVEYATDLFDHDTIEKFIHHYLHILEAVTTNPHRHIDTIEIINPAERHQVLTDWNNTTTVIPEATVPELFAAQVTRTPDTPAIEDDHETLTYRQLDARADQLAYRLKAYGVQPETIIAVVLPRSARLVTALLAIAKTGAVYLPIDPNYPSERTSYILADAAPRLLITDTPATAALPHTNIPH